MRSPQRIWLGRPLEFVRGNSVGLRETQTPLLKGTHKVSCIPGPSGKKQWPHKSQSRLTCYYWVGGREASPVEAGGSYVLRKTLSSLSDDGWG